MIRSRSNPARMRRPWLLVPLLLAGWTVSAGAEWSHDPYENNPVLVGADHALDAVATTDGQGGMIVATLLSLETGGTALVAQRIDAQGDPVWNGTSGIAVFAQTGSYSAPVIVSDGNGGAYVGMSIVQSGYYHAFLQWIRNDGALPWGPSGVDLAPAAGAANQNRIALAAREIDGCIAAWDDARNDAGDVYAQHVTPAGTRLWGTSGLPIVNAVDFQGYVKTESDGFGGAYLIWRDARNYATNSHDIYAQHLTAGGTPDWTANGLAISAGSGSQFNPGVLSDEAGFVFFYYEDEAGGDDNIWVRKFTIRGDYWYSVMPCEEPTAENDPVLASDGRGGVYIAWCDYRDDGYAGKDIYAQWIDTSGAPRWTAGGVRIGATETNQYTPDICADGQGGAIISYRIPGGFFYQLYAQRLSSLGYRMWGSLGKLIASPPGGVAHVTLLADDRNGALMAWVDTRPGYYSDVYAQRIDYYGYLGDPAPQVTAVGDYPNDQGGRLIVDWSRSYLDTPEFDTIYDYSVWRRNAGATKRSDVEPSDEILARVVATTGLSPQDARAYLKSGWALEGELGAFHFEEYSYRGELRGLDRRRHPADRVHGPGRRRRRTVAVECPGRLLGRQPGAGSAAGAVRRSGRNGHRAGMDDARVRCRGSRPLPHLPRRPARLPARRGPLPGDGGRHGIHRRRNRPGAVLLPGHRAGHPRERGESVQRGQRVLGQRGRRRGAPGDRPARQLPEPLQSVDEHPVRAGSDRHGAPARAGRGGPPGADPARRGDLRAGPPRRGLERAGRCGSAAGLGRLFLSPGNGRLRRHAAHGVAEVMRPGRVRDYLPSLSSRPEAFSLTSSVTRSRTLSFTPACAICAAASRVNAPITAWAI